MPDIAIAADRLGALASKRVVGLVLTAATPAPNNDPNAPGGAPGVNPILGYDFSGFTDAVWDVAIVTGLPTYTWQTWRYVEGLGRWLLQDTAAGVTTDRSVAQRCDGDRVLLRISAIAGAGAELQIACRGVNRERR